MKKSHLAKQIIASALLAWFLFPLRIFGSEKEPLLTEPCLQSPTDTSVNVVWFTKSKAENSYVQYGKQFKQKADAVTTKLSRMRTFQNVPVDIYRHEAVITGLPRNITGNEKVPYRVVSGQAVGKTYHLQAKPQSGVPLNILFTSDSQVKEMTAANYQKAVETAGHIDAVFYAGDLVNIADQADEWFPLTASAAFFPMLQGTANKKIGNKTYTGGAILQEAPIYTAPGNHEYMGRFSTIFDLGLQFNDTMPADYGNQDQTFNTISYRELFDIPSDNDKLYYAVSIGDIRLVVLNVTRMWRSNELNTKGAYSEDIRDLGNPNTTSGGSIIYEPIKKGSEQYNWFKKETQSEPFQTAKYRIVMFHHALHGLGGNIVPAFTDPVRNDIYDENGKLQQITYDYPKDQDYLLNDLEPLLIESGTDLVLNGHSHLWNRFRDEWGMNYLETSNVGNTYGAYDGTPSQNNDGIRTSRIPSDMNHFEKDNYILSGDPGGLTPIMPTLRNQNGKPYIASDTLTVFTILNTKTGIIESYWYDTKDPESRPVKFDSFQLKRVQKSSSAE